jgi:hypothetical protein
LESSVDLSKVMTRENKDPEPQPPVLPARVDTTASFSAGMMSLKMVRWGDFDRSSGPAAFRDEEQSDEEGFTRYLSQTESTSG